MDFIGVQYLPHPPSPILKDSLRVKTCLKSPDRGWKVKKPQRAECVSRGPIQNTHWGEGRGLQSKGKAAAYTVNSMSLRIVVLKSNHRHRTFWRQEHWMSLSLWDQWPNTSLERAAWKQSPERGTNWGAASHSHSWKSSQVFSQSGNISNMNILLSCASLRLGSRALMIKMISQWILLKSSAHDSLCSYRLNHSCWK